MYPALQGLWKTFKINFNYEYLIVLNLNKMVKLVELLKLKFVTDYGLNLARLLILINQIKKYRLYNEVHFCTTC